MKFELGLPRMRGDRPLDVVLEYANSVFTPHARGSTFHNIPRPCAHCVYPACAGIDPAARSDWILQSSLPRMRGDRPHI